MLSGIHASEMQFAPNITYQPDHTVHRICVVLAGSFVDLRYRGTAGFGRGTVVFRPTSERAPIRFGTNGMRSLTIELSPEAGEELFKAVFCRASHWR